MLKIDKVRAKQHAIFIVIDYLTHLLDQDTVIDLLKQVIGVENKVK